MRNAFKIIALHPIQIIQFINYASQRVYGIVLGYEDVNDHDKLRYDPALAIALEKLDFINSEKTGLAGKSTINRRLVLSRNNYQSKIKSLS